MPPGYLEALASLAVGVGLIGSAVLFLAFLAGCLFTLAVTRLGRGQ